MDWLHWGLMSSCQWLRWGLPTWCWCSYLLGRLVACCGGVFCEFSSYKSGESPSPFGCRGRAVSFMARSAATSWANVILKRREVSMSRFSKDISQEDRVYRQIFGVFSLWGDKPAAERTRSLHDVDLKEMVSCYFRFLFVEGKTKTSTKCVSTVGSQ